MKDKHICPKCDHREILFVTQVSDAIGTNSQFNHGHPVDTTPYQNATLVSQPMRVARVEENAEKMLGFTYNSMQTLSGILRAYVCRGCGYTEFYTELPETVPVDGDLVRLLKGPDKPAPYR